MNSNLRKIIIKLNTAKLAIFLTALIYLSGTFSQIYGKSNENINVSDINIYSQAAILLDTDTGDVLYSKNGNSKVFPASTTKILTAMLAIENLDLNSTVVVSKTSVILPPGSSNVALKAGEVISVKDLLHCLLLNSGNDSANVLAEAVSGTIPDFIFLMNSKVKELGLTETNFSNSHGYHDNKHYTTPYEMMGLLKYAIKNDIFRTLVSTKSYIVPPTNKTPTERTLKSTNRLILTKSDSYLSNYYEYCLGGKTGFTDEAGRTFVAFGKKGDRNVVLGTFNVMDVGNKDGRYIDAISLFEYGFNNFEKTLAIEKDNFEFEYIDKNNGYKYILGIKDDVYFSTKTSEENYGASVSTLPVIDYKLLNEYTYDTTSSSNCQVVGSINVTLTQNSNIINKDVPLVLIENSKLGLFESISTVDFSGFKVIIYVLLSVLLLIFIFIILILRKNIRRRKKHYIKSRETMKQNAYIVPNYVSRRTPKKPRH